MLVKWNKENVLSIGVADPKKEHKAGQPMPVKFCKILPGIGKIKDEDWSVLKDHPKIKLLIKAKDLEVVNAKAANEKEMEAEKTDNVDLGNMKAGEAIEVVKQCLDMDILKEWEESEERTTVSKAISKQMKVLELTDAEREALKK